MLKVISYHIHFNIAIIFLKFSIFDTINYYCQLSLYTILCDFYKYQTNFFNKLLEIDEIELMKLQLK